MCSKDTNICCGDKISPDKPIEFMRFTSISPCGKTVSILKLCCPLQEITFENGLCLVGNAVTLKVPKYICGEDGVFYEVLKPTEDDISIQDINMEDLEVTIVESHCKDLYYVTIPVTEEMLSECKLVIRICKFNLTLDQLSCCEAHRIKKCRKEGWKWIPSMIITTEN